MLCKIYKCGGVRCGFKKLGQKVEIF